MTSETHGPLSGIVVLDLATIFAGPSACRHLGDFGADVIKVERPGVPDGARHLGETDGDDSFYWRITGRNKRPIELDLKQPTGREVLLDLVRNADVLVENFRPGTLERLGLGPEEVLLVENPGLVVLRVTGYGQTARMPTGRDSARWRRPCRRWPTPPDRRMGRRRFPPWHWPTRSPGCRARLRS